MADFDKAFTKVCEKEGGYVNNPNDRGGETYMGICRKNYPKNYMWEIIDRIKQKVGNIAKEITKAAKLDKDLTTQVKWIYKKYYWDKLKLDEVKSQRIADMAFDDAVNRGTVAAIKTLQKTVKLPITGRMSKELIEKLK